jgi:hypothetical protein
MRRGAMARKEVLDLRAEVRPRFMFLVTEHGYAGPTPIATPNILRYTSPEWVIQIRGADPPRKPVTGRIEVSVDHGPDTSSVGSVDLADLVAAAKLAPRHAVAWKAHTVEAARLTLDDNARWLRQLLPRLTTEWLMEVYDAAIANGAQRPRPPHRSR